MDDIFFAALWTSSSFKVINFKVINQKLEKLWEHISNKQIQEKNVVRKNDVNKQEKIQSFTYNGIKDGHHNINAIITSYIGFSTTMFFWNTCVKLTSFIKAIEIIPNVNVLLFTYCYALWSLTIEIECWCLLTFIMQYLRIIFRHFHFFPKRSHRLLKIFDLKKHFKKIIGHQCGILKILLNCNDLLPPPPTTYYFCYNQHLMNEPQCFDRTKECW
jgi:hypothetical protein